jgi:hypothetical protein
MVERFEVEGHICLVGKKKQNYTWIEMIITTSTQVSIDKPGCRIFFVE